MIRLLTYLMLSGAAFGGIYYVVNARNQRKVRLQFIQFWRDLEEKVDHFLRKRLTLTILEEENQDSILENIQQEASEYINSDLTLLKSLIGTHLGARIQLEKERKIFSGAMTVAELELKKGSSSEEVMEDLEAAILQALNAEIGKRYQDLRIESNLNTQSDSEDSLN